MSSPQPNIDWQRVLGPVVDVFNPSELEQLTVATTTHPLRAIRLHPNRSVDDLPFAVDSIPWFPQGHFLSSSSIRPGEFLHSAAGDYYIQDAGSMLALALCELSPGQWVCDTCASPGGKSTGALEQLAGTGLVVANEVIGSRLTILNLAIARSGFANSLVTSFEVDRLSQHLGARFDCVIVDAPCTGQSMVVRGKQSLAAYSAAQIEHSSARQRRIVRAAAKLVKPGGRLVYSTCTFSFAENEHILGDLIDEQPDWKLKRFDHLSPWETPGFAGCYRLWPHRDRCAGAFAACAVRSEKSNEADALDAAQLAPPVPISKQAWQPLTSIPTELEWITEAAGDLPSGQWYMRGELIHRFEAECPREWIELASSGVAMAERKEGRFEPLYGSAVVQHANLTHQQIVELSDQDAAKFVAGEAIRFPSTTSGWCRVTWRGRPLAWGKLAAGVLKNHYPKALRQAKHA